MDIDPESRSRRSIRLKEYVYSAAGGYYVTVVSFQGDCLFGDVVDGEMRLNALGKIVQEEWFKTAALHPYVELREDEFVAMPNHMHGIIWIMNDDVWTRRTGFVGAQHRCVPAQNVMPHSLGAIVRAFKSAVTYRANHELNFANIWQRNYYENIICDQTDFERIAGYVLANPFNWNDDDENPMIAIK
jgi:putative transposase